MAFDFIHSKITVPSDGLSVTSGSVDYTGYNGEITFKSGNCSGSGILFVSGTLSVRNGLVVNVFGSQVSASTVTY